MINKQEDYDYKPETKSNDQLIAHRQKLYELFDKRSMPDDQLMVTGVIYEEFCAYKNIICK